MILCESIDTLAMAYLDDELAAEERRELELHLTECTTCRAHLDAERAEHALLRKALVAPPASDLLRTKIARALDAEDRVAARAERKRWSSWLLPGSAVTAAAAAIVVFVGMRPPSPHVGSVASEAARQQSRTLPLDVQGASTAPWVKEHFAPEFIPPVFLGTGLSLKGSRLTAVYGHDAVLLAYQADSFALTALVVRDVGDDDLGEGSEFQLGNRTLHVIQAKDRVAISYVAPDHTGYMFFAPELTVDELLQIVVASDLFQHR
jgi:anti-sigma factor RsiW